MLYTVDVTNNASVPIIETITFTTIQPGDTETVVVGSFSDLESNIAQINALRGFTALQAILIGAVNDDSPEYAQEDMPLAASVPVGTEVWNTTYKVFMRSDGTRWIAIGPVVVYGASPVDSVSGTTSLTALRSIRIPGGLVGENGKVLVEPVLTYTSNANAKNLSIRIGQTSDVALSTSLWTHAQPNSSTSVFPYRFQNSGSQAAQIGGTSGATNGSVGQSTAAAPPTSAVDTAQDWYLFLAATPANAGDTVGLAALTVTINQKWN